MRRALLLAAILWATPAAAEPRVVVLKSESAKGAVGPYEEATKAFVDTVQDESFKGLRLSSTIVISPVLGVQYTVDSVKEYRPDLLVAFGSEAARFAAQQFPDLPRVVALAPGVNGPGNGEPMVLLSSEVPAEMQIKWISDVLPDVTSVGVVYDPRATEHLVDELAGAAEERSRGGRSLSVVRIPVSSETEVPAPLSTKYQLKPIAGICAASDSFSR